MKLSCSTCRCRWNFVIFRARFSQTPREFKWSLRPLTDIIRRRNKDPFVPRVFTRDEIECNRALCLVTAKLRYF